VRARPEAGHEIRAFIAVPFDADARAAAAVAVARLREAGVGREVRWVRAEELHVTLRFLGNVALASLPELVLRVRAETDRLVPFRLRPGVVVPFPSARRPRVVALSLEPEPELARLAAAVERGVVAAGHAPESRPFRAHCTLGRVRGPGRPPANLVTVPVTVPEFTLHVTEAVLYRSEPDRADARYTPLERLPLAGPGANDHPYQDAKSTGGNEAS
jgi:2'-5' RNA ligase